MVIFLTGYIDYITGPDLSFSVFYLIPLSFLSLHKKSNPYLIIMVSLIAAIIWFLADFNTSQYDLLFYPLWNTSVRFIIFIVIGFLLYSLKQNEQRLKKLNKDLKDLNEEKNRLIGIAAHDLRSPIGAVYAFSDLLLDRYRHEEPELIRIIQLIKKTSGDTLVVLGNLLDVSKLESGMVSLNVKRHDYKVLVHEQVELYRILAAQKNIDIKIKVPDQDLQADFDEHYLGEVVGNLLSNAIKFSKKGTSVSVHVTLLENEILTEVVDEGMGILEAEQKNLFQFFQRTSTRPTEGEKSTGLGLAIAKQIVDLHKGDIGVKSSPGEGSRFFFRIPLHR